MVTYPKFSEPDVWHSQLPDALSLRRGWVCPLCGRVYAPMLRECWYCGTQQRRYYYADGVVVWFDGNGVMHWL